MSAYTAPHPVLALLGTRGRVLQVHAEPGAGAESVEDLAHWFWTPGRPLAGLLRELLCHPAPEGVEVERVLPDGSHHPGRLFVHRWHETHPDARLLLAWYPDPHLVGAASQEGMRRFLLQVRILLDRARGCAAEVREGRSPGGLEVLMTLLDRACGLLGTLDAAEVSPAVGAIRD